MNDALYIAATGMRSQATQLDAIANNVAVPAGVVMVSPSATSPALTTIEDNGYFFRTAPSDLLAGPVLAEQMLADNHVNIAVVARADDYGHGYLEAVQDELEDIGAEVVFTDTYDPDANPGTPHVRSHQSNAPIRRHTPRLPAWHLRRPRHVNPTPLPGEGRDQRQQRDDRRKDKALEIRERITPVGKGDRDIAKMGPVVGCDQCADASPHHP